MKEKNRSAIKWMSAAAGGQKLGIAVLTLFQALLGASGVLYAAIFRSVIDSAAEGSRRGFRSSLLLLAGLVVFRLVTAAAGNIMHEKTRASLENRFKQRLFFALMKKDYASVTAVHSGEWMNRLTSDSAVAADGLCGIVPGITGMLVKLIGALIMIFALEPEFGLVLIPCGAVVLFVSYALRKRLKDMHRTVREKDGALRVFLQENLGSLITVRSFAAEEQTVSESAELMEEHKKSRMKRVRFSTLCSAGFGTAVNGAYLIGLCYCGIGIINKTVSYGTLMAILQLISQIQSPFAEISGYLPRYYAMTASAERLMEAESFADDFTGSAKTSREISESYKNDIAAIGLENAEFTYYPPVRDPNGGVGKSDMPTVISGLGIEIKKGEFAAFTGRSGCGKSTVLKLLMCLYPLDGGERYILRGDGSRIPLTPEWHRLFAYVPQGNRLMCGTVREIVAFSDRSAMYDEERLERALKIACADEFAAALENGADTLLGERGLGLSEGQAQRIAIARAVFSEAPILLLDECTSALDEATEKRLLANLRSMTDKTVLIVTHRPAALRICDKVFKIGEE